MSDLLVELGQSPWIRKTIQSLGLPLPMPQKLRRAKGAYTPRPLEGRNAIFAAAPNRRLASVIAQTLAAAGANPFVVGDEADAAPFRDAGEAYGRPPQLVTAGEPGADAQIFDGTGIEQPSELRALYDFFHPRIRDIARFVGKVSARVSSFCRREGGETTPDSCGPQAYWRGRAPSTSSTKR